MTFFPTPTCSLPACSFILCFMIADIHLSTTYLEIAADDDTTCNAYVEIGEDRQFSLDINFTETYIKTYNNQGDNR